MQHAILGAGGIGGLIGAVLANAGEQVTLVVRPATEQRYPRELSLDSPLGKIKAPVSIEASVKQAFDVLWICTKATQLEEALHGVRGDLTFRAVVPLLNGIDHVERLRQRFGNAVVPATIAVESERVAPGIIVHRSPFVRFNLASSGKALLANVVDAFRRFGFDCKFFDDEPTLLWSKLVFLGPVALSTTAGKCPIGDVMGDPARRERLEACVREACAVASAAGAKVDPHAILAFIKNLPPEMRSSMEKDVTSGNIPELDAISGPIVRAGAKYGIPVRATAELVQAVQQQIAK